MHTKKLLAGLLVVLVVGSLLSATLKDEANTGSAMVTTAQDFLKTLGDDQLRQSKFAYNDKERLNWHFIPRVRKGLPLRDLEGKSLAAAHRLIRSGLSEAGYTQSLNVMSLEELLYLLEKGDRAKRRERRDPEKYYLSVFGLPSLKGTWGWRLEGHHLSLNYTITNGRLVATTPEFFGANPGTVDAGKGRRIRVLGIEEDLARQVLKLCSPAQQKVAWIDKKAPDDLRGGGVAQPDTTPPVGLTIAKMSPDQRKLMRLLLTEYLKNMPAEIEAERRAAINKAGIDKITFAWWGSDKPDERHYYRVQGSTFLIEYNNTQNSANHVHSIWRNLAGDFNVTLKRGS